MKKLLDNHLSIICGLFLLSLCYVDDAYALSWHDLWRTPDQQAAKLLAEGDGQQASTKFENENWQAAANYRAGNYQQALEGFAKGDSAQSDYNRGNALAQLGQYEAAIAAYDAALKQDPNDADAQFNRQIAEQLLDQQQQNQDQQNNDQQNNDQQSPQQNQPPQQPPAGDDQSPQNQASDQSTPPDQPTPQDSDDQDNSSPAQAADQLSAQQREQQNSAEQLLRQVPDDPGGLLRQKFLRDHLRKQQGMQ